MLTPLNLIVFAGVIALMTYLSTRSAKRTTSSRGFFAAEGGLPWWAVASSIVATNTSTVTFLAVPTAVFIADGNLTYAQIVFGFGIGIAGIAFIFARSCYEMREANTVVDYVALRSHPHLGLFKMVWATGTALLSYSLRLLATALIVSVVMRIDLLPAMILAAALATMWSVIGGIRTVIWTDFVMFFIFASGAIFSACWIFFSLDSTAGELWQVLDEHGKLVWLDLSVDPAKSFTLWTAMLAVPFTQLLIGAGQGTFQRIRSCRSVRDAKLAYLSSIFFSFTPFVMMAVGLGLYLFYRENPLSMEVTEQLAQQPDRIFAHFIVTELPDGISGLLILALLCAGVSTTNSSLAELADITISNIYRPFIVRTASDQHYLRASRVAVTGWACVLTVVAYTISFHQDAGILKLAFQLPAYGAGISLGIMLLARFNFRPSLIAFYTSVGISFLAVLWLQKANVNFWWWYPVATLLFLGCTTAGTRLLGVLRR